MHATTPDLLQSTVTTQLATVLTQLTTWAQAEPRTLAVIEQAVLPLLQALGQTMVAGCALLQAPPIPPQTIACACGHAARALRQRPATVITLLGRITIPRTYYHCSACGTGHYPVDTQLEICAGSRSAGLDDLLALLGATQDSFAQAAAVLARLTLVQVSPNTVRDATERLGAALNAHTLQEASRTLADADPPTVTPPPRRLYIAMDGVFAHLHARGWSEIKVGCCFETHPGRLSAHPDRADQRTLRPSYLAALTEAAPFGERLWAEAARRGVLDADEVIVVSDGAHWIWNLARTHFPDATQILDWFHASQYVWTAATAIWGETGAERTQWGHQQEAALWAGNVAAVLAELTCQAATGADVSAAIGYYTTHQGRMDYAAYRARGLQIGSGSVESGCKQLVTARLKQAGMIWNADGAAAVATVRAWLKSDRWAEAMAVRPVRQRPYVRRAAAAAPAVALPPDPAPLTGRPAGLPPGVLAQIQADLAEERAIHPWRRGPRRHPAHREPTVGAESPLVTTA